MSPQFEIDGKVALVTGASGGLGHHFARTLAAAGARLALAARSRDRLAANVAEIEAAGGKALAVEMDVTDATSVERGLAAVADAFGVATIIVNNSGVVTHDTALELKPEGWDQVMDTNVKGAWLVAAAAARRMIEAGVGGSVINIASILGLRVAGRVAPYAASKSALIHLSHSLALEWARYGIRVNALAPGYIETDLNREFFDSDPGKALIGRIPQRRLGRREDLDGALLLLASDASAYMTGSTLVVDGGHLQSSL